MEVDLNSLCTLVVSTVLIPYIKDGAEKIAEKIKENVTADIADATVNVARTVWARVKSIFSAEDEKSLVEDFKKYPDDTAPLLRRKLIEKLKADPSLVKFFHELLEQPLGQEANLNGAQIMGAYIAGIADVRGANFSSSRNVSISGITNNYEKPFPDDEEDK